MTDQIIPRTHDKNMPLNELRTLVDAGDWDAKAIYASRLVLGNGIEKDSETGLPMLYQAHEAGAARATAELAFRHVDENGPLPRDLEKAEEYAALAIERGNPYGWAARSMIAEAKGDDSAGFEAGKTLLSLIDPAERDMQVVYSVGAMAHFAGRYDEAVPFYEEAAEGGVPAAAINLALMISRGQCNVDTERELDLLRQAAAAGAPAGLTLFAHRALMPHVFDRPQDPELQKEAVQLMIVHPARGGDFEVNYLLAYANEHGLGKDQDDAMATRLYGVAAKNEVAHLDGPRVLGAGRANIAYAVRLAEGLGTDPDPSAAFDHLERAAQIAMEAENIEMAGAAAQHARRIFDAAGQPDLKKRLLGLLELGAQSGESSLMIDYAKTLVEETGRMTKARPWFVRGLAAENPAAGIVAAELLLDQNEEAEAYAFAQGAVDLGADLPPALAALSPDKRAKGILLMKGKTGEALHGELKEAIAKTVAQFGFHEDDQA